MSSTDEHDTDPGGSGEPFHQHEKVVRDRVQIGWRSVDTGIMCDCPVYERSPHANSEPVMVDRDVYDRARHFDRSREGVVNGEEPRRVT